MEERMPPLLRPWLEALEYEDGLLAVQVKEPDQECAETMRGQKGTTYTQKQTNTNTNIDMAHTVTETIT